MYWGRSLGTMTQAEANMWEWRAQVENDYELCTFQRYADSKKGQAERLKAWFATIEEAEYYVNKGKTYERPATNARGRKKKTHG